MSEKNEQATATQKAQTPSQSTPSPGFATSGVGRTSQRGTTPPGKPVAGKQERFIITPRRTAGIMYPIGLQPLTLDYVEQALRSGRLSARGLQRVRRVALTLADLWGCSGPLGSDQVSLALSLRADAVGFGRG